MQGLWKHAGVIALVSMAVSQAGAAGDKASGALPTVRELTNGAERREGLLETFVDSSQARIWLSLPEAADGESEIARFLYTVGLSAGLGSNDIGLDRGLLGRTRLVAFRRLGNRLLVEEINLRFRALTTDLEEQRAVRESFARSVLWAGEIEATAEGRRMVDFTSFVVRDALGVARRLAATEQGSFALDPERSSLDPAATLSFPENLEMESVLTWGASEPGAWVSNVAATPAAVTLVQHQSLIRLPDEGYRPRRFDPRAGSFAIHFNDYSSSLERSIETSWIVRHRLVKTDPRRARSTVVEPIVYYVDRGVPEPVRSALLEGAGWWEAAFDNAGFIDAFRVELLPEGIHPLDARYNVIEWVHRSTRGWSNGNGIVDPRTGEMIKGHVRLGSLRVRQDRLLFEGLAGTSKTGTGAPDDPIELALARIRQLSAHEVGHTLGLAHNFAASTYADRASVMDYPAPRVLIDDEGELDFADAYGVAVGRWDLHAIEYAYSEFAPGKDEGEELAAIVERAIEKGWIYLTDADARPAGAANPLANLWDNGADPVAELARTLRVRRIGLDRFGEANVAVGTPLSRLEEVLVPLYLHHRYQLDAAIKVVGGWDYSYALRGDPSPPLAPIDAARQREALEVVLSTLDTAVLELPQRITDLIPPRPPGSPSSRELFAGSTSPLFDPHAAAATAARMTIAGLLQPERAARLVRAGVSAAPSGVSFDYLLQALVSRVFPAEPDRVGGEIRDEVQRVLVSMMIELASSPATSDAVRLRVDSALAGLRQAMSGLRVPTRQQLFLLDRLTRYRDRRGPVASTPPAGFAPPPGSPIGSLGACSYSPIR